MAYQFLLYDVADGICTITLNRPEVLNAVHLPMLKEMAAVQEQAEDDPNVHCVIVKGAGRAFCVGRDLKWSSELGQRDADGWRAWRHGSAVSGGRVGGPWSGWFLLNKAVIAQVHGYAVGGGIVMAAMSDITIAAESAVFGFPELRVGGWRGPGHIFYHFMSQKKVKEYLFTGAPGISAAEAVQVGLANRVVPDDKLEETARMMAKDIVLMDTKFPGYIRGYKADINKQRPDLVMMASSYWAENNDVIRDLTMARPAREGVWEKTVVEKGMHAGLSEMHGGFSTKGGEAPEQE